MKVKAVVEIEHEIIDEFDSDKISQEKKNKYGRLKNLLQEHFNELLSDEFKGVRVSKVKVEVKKGIYMNCGNSLCLYHKTNNTCSYTANNLSNPELGEDCHNFDYDCDICKGEGFQHFGCLNCDLTPEEYYGEE